MHITFEEFAEWSKIQDYYIFSGCVEENYPAVKEGLLTIGKNLGHKFHTYSDQSCCSGPLTKMGLGNTCTLGEYTQANLDLRINHERIILTSCNGCYSYMIKSDRTITDIDEAINYQKNIEEEDHNNNGKNNQEDNQKDKITLLEKDPPPLLLHAVEYLSTWASQIHSLIKYPLRDVNFVLQYGCHYLNQYRLSLQQSFRNLYAEHKKIPGWDYNSIPSYLNDIIEPFGGTITEYNELTLCCGGSTPQRQINMENAQTVAEKKFESIHHAEPDAVLTICPLCMYFMEDSQCMSELESKFDKKIPIIHINELLGMMIGNDDLIPLIKKSHKIDLQPLIDKIVTK